MRLAASGPRPAARGRSSKGGGREGEEGEEEEEEEEEEDQRELRLHQRYCHTDSRPMPPPQSVTPGAQTAHWQYKKLCVGPEKPAIAQGPGRQEKGDWAEKCKQ